MEINGETRVIGIIGNPVRHTMSPAIHNYISKQLGKNMVYVPFEVTGNVDTAVRGAYELGILGMNVTVPWKSEVIASLSSIDEMARRIGAVNTLVYTENGYKGYNTDMYGLERELKDENVSLEGRDAVLVGAGGAARAAAFLCALHDVKSLTILNRTVEKAETIAEDVRAYIKDNGKNILVKALPLSDYDKIDQGKLIVFQCTKIGLNENDGAAIMDENFYKKIDVGVDLIYREGTAFQNMVRDAGGRSYTGLKMLLFQGVCAYELWNDIKVDDSIIDGVKGVLNV